MSDRRSTSRLFNASGRARELRASPLFAIATGALVNGFPGMDAPAKARAGWQAATAPLIGIAAALGILSSQSAPAAVLALGLCGLLAGYCFAVSLRLAIVGLTVALAMLIAQGLFLPAGDADSALLWGTLGGLSQVAWSLVVEYALFTAAITTYVVLMSATLGEPAFDAAGQRALGTVLGILIAFVAWRLWPDSRSPLDLAGQPNLGGAES